MSRRPHRNLDEKPDFVLGPEPTPMTPYWLNDGPSDGTIVHVPQGTERVFVAHPADEVALTIEAAAPRIAVYERDMQSASGGFNVLRYKRTVPLGFAQEVPR